MNGIQIVADDKKEKSYKKLENQSEKQNILSLFDSV